MKKIVLFLIFLSCLGAVYQFICEQNRYPAPGKMVDMGGYKFHIKIAGEEHINGPTVVLEMGGGGSCLHWSLVQPEIAKFARVVSYDRGGYGWSDASPKIRTSENIAQELYEVLQRAGIKGPYILVGHSFGGMAVRLFAKKHPKDVTGIVLVDAVHENQPGIFPPSANWILKSLEYPLSHSMIKAANFLGVLRIFKVLERPNNFSKETYRQMTSNFYTSKFITAALEEYEYFRKSQQQIKESGNLGDIPLIVLSAGKRRVPIEFWEKWQAFQKDLTQKSTRSKQIIAPNSGHKMNQEAPEVITQAVKELFPF